MNRVTASYLGLVAVLAVTPLAAPIQAATTAAPTLMPHRFYGGGAGAGAVVILRTGTATTITATPVNTRPELFHSSINFHCADGNLVATGMPAIALASTAGHYGFSTRFVVKGLKKEGPGATLPAATVSVAVSGKVENSKTVTGTVRVTGTMGCNLPAHAYRATLGFK